MQSLLRWLRRVGLTALALVAIVAGAALIAAHTGWGRERLRRGIEAALGDAFPGGARLAALDGSLLGTLTLRGVELDAADHRPVVTAGVVEVSVALWPLALQVARLDRVVAQDVRVVVHDRPPADADRAGSPSAWQVEIPALEVHRAAVEVDRAGLRIDRLDAAGAARIADGQVTVWGAVHGRWSRAPGAAAELTAGGSAVLDAGVRIPGAIAVLDGATVIASALAVDLDHPAGAITVAAPAAVVAAQVPELGARLPGDLAVAIGLAADGAATRMSITAAAGEARLWASLRGEPARRTARGLISATAIDLGAASRGQLAGRGHLLAALDAGPGRARGALIAYGDLALAGLPVRRAGVALAGSLDGVTALALVSGDDALRAAAVARGHLGGAALWIDHARAVAAATGLAVAGRRITGALALDAATGAPFALGAPGRIVGVAVGRGVTAAPDPAPAGAARVAVGAVRAPFALTLGGPGAAVAVAVGDAHATAVGRGELAADAARGSLAFGVAPVPGPDGDLELRFDAAQLAVTRIRRAGALLGDARVDVARHGAGYRVVAAAQPPVAGLAIDTEAIVRRAAGAYAAALGVTRVRLPDGAAWSGRGGALVIPDDDTVPLRLLDLTLRRGDAAIALTGRYTPASGELVGHAGAERIDPAALGPAAVASGATGLGRAAIEVSRRGGQWQADAALAVAGLALGPGAAPVDASAHVALGRRRATLDAHVTGPALGDLGLALDVAAPGDPFDPGAWRRLDRSALHTAAITAHGVAIAGLAGALGPGRAIRGTVDGTLDLAPPAPHGELAVRGLALPGTATPGAIDGELTVAPVDGDLDARAAARLAGIAAAKLSVRLAAPEHPFDPDTWRRGRELVRAASATVDDVAFDPALLARLGGDPRSALPLSGHLGARLAVGPGARDLELEVQLSGVTGGRLVGPVSPRVTLRAGPSGTRVHAELRGGPGSDGGALRLGTLDGEVPITVDRWLAEPAAVLHAPLSARWTLDPVPLAPVLALLGPHEAGTAGVPDLPIARLEAGTVEGNAMIGGTIATPIVPSAGLVARDLKFAPLLGGRAVPAVRALAVAATWDGTGGSLKIRGSEAAGGELDATLIGRPDAPLGATGTARLTRLDVAPIAALLPGALVSAAGVVDGELALAPGGRLSGHLHVTGGALPLAAAVGTLRDATADVTSDVAGLHGQLRGRLGRGTIRVEADARPDLSGATANIVLAGVSPITALRPVISARLTARLHREAGQLRGSVDVDDGASIALPASAGTPLLDPAVPDDLLLPGAPARPRGPRVPTHPWLVLEVNAPAIRFDAPDLGEGVGLTGTLHSDRLEVSIGDTVGVTGKLAVESDDFELFGRRYVVEPTRDGPSSLAFDGTLDPTASLAMSHAFPSELTLHVDVSGRLSKLDPLRFSSDPAGLYTQDQLFAFFLGGEPTADPVSSTRSVAVGAVTGLGTRLISGEIGKRLGRLLPVKLDTLACEPDPAGITTTSGSCTVGKWLLQRVYLAYTQHLQPGPDENTGDAQVQVRLWREILFQGTGGDRGFYGADLLWQHRW